MAQPKAFPQKGFDYITTGTETGEWYVILALEETDIDASGSNQDDLVGCVIPAGVSISGRFTSITINSGRLIAYRY